MSAVKEILDYISKAEQTYLKMPKKHKKEVDAILTATTLIKMKCKQAKELEEKQKDEFAISFYNWVETEETQQLIFDLQMMGELPKELTTQQLLEIYKKENL